MTAHWVQPTIHGNKQGCWSIHDKPPYHEVMLMLTIRCYLLFEKGGSAHHAIVKTRVG
jgi:hypothetical protein